MCSLDHVLGVRIPASQPVLPTFLLGTSAPSRPASKLEFTLTHERLADGRAKIRILRAVDRARAFVPLRGLLRFLRLPFPRVGSMPGDACSTRVRLTISRLVLTRRPID